MTDRIEHRTEYGIEQNMSYVFESCKIEYRIEHTVKYNTYDTEYNLT